MSSAIVRPALIALSITLALAACSTSGGVTPTSEVSSPAQANQTIFSNAFFPDTPKITNPYLPYIPGTKYIIRGKVNKQPEKEVQIVGFTTRKIAGVNCTIVHDRVWVNNILEERTEDYYAQDFYGNVWYFGEYETSFHPRRHKDSWLAGVHGASPGIMMEAEPRVGDQYYQEHAPKAHAEDQARILTLTTNVHTPFGNFFGNVLETNEFSKFEPGVRSHKYYEPGYGEMEEHVVRGGPEILKLTGVVVKKR